MTHADLATVGGSRKHSAIDHYLRSRFRSRHLAVVFAFYPCTDSQSP